MDPTPPRPAARKAPAAPVVHAQQPAAGKDTKKLQLQRDNTWASGIERAAAAATGELLYATGELRYG